MHFLRLTEKLALLIKGLVLTEDPVLTGDPSL